MSFNNLIERLKGGAGSGNFGHSGRPGKTGGSAPGGGGGGAAGSAIELVANIKTKLLNGQYGSDRMLGIGEDVENYIAESGNQRLITSLNRAHSESRAMRKLPDETKDETIVRHLWNAGPGAKEIENEVLSMQRSGKR